MMTIPRVCAHRTRCEPRNDRIPRVDERRHQIAETIVLPEAVEGRIAAVTWARSRTSGIYVVCALGFPSIFSQRPPRRSLFRAG